ncbi:MAG: hypothetical protein NTZ60_11985 [Campylobacterales bacterium]|nr:hypothetical protein [Campylobacterales bacterium]
MTNKEIETIYEIIIKNHKEHLSSLGIKLPKLKNGDSFTMNSLVLVYLAKDYPNTKIVSKEELTQFIKNYFPDVNDVQQGRHLARQGGWYIVSGQRGDITDIKIPAGSYKLISLKKPYPAFTSHRNINFTGNFWENLKQTYHNRCASCGSPENEANYINPSATTQLQQGHMNPEKPLEEGNIIPQCQECNRGDRNRWIYDKRGRVTGLTQEALLSRIKKLDKKTASIVVKFLQEKFHI